MRGAQSFRNILADLCHIFLQDYIHENNMKTLSQIRIVQLKGRIEFIADFYFNSKRHIDTGKKIFFRHGKSKHRFKKILLGGSVKFGLWYLVPKL